MDFYTTDLSDKFEDRVRVCEPLFNSYGGATHLSGPVSTVKVSNDNVMVREALETLPEGTVLVVDGGASVSCALIGGNLAEIAATRGLGGIIVNGCVRDSHEIAALNIGVLALATHPKKSRKEGKGEKDVTVAFGGIDFVAGHYLYADGDGVILSDEPLV